MPAITEIARTIMAESGTNHTLAHFVYEGNKKIMENALK